MRFPLIVALLTAPALAGCIDGPLEESTGLDPNVVTDPGDYSYLDDAGQDNRSHLHDYWGGETSIVVMQETVDDGGTLCGSDPTLRVRFQPESPIPMGTARVDVTVQWTEGDGNAYDHVELLVKSAADDEAALVGPVDNGGKLAIESTNEMNDIPHQLMSNWAFDVAFKGVATSPNTDPVCMLLLADRTVEYHGEITVTVVAHRGLDIPLFPGHPDRWGGAASLDLADHEADWTAYTRTFLFGTMCFPCSGHYVTPLDGAVVPPDASHVTVELVTVKRGVHDLGLVFHGSDTRDWTVLTPDTVQEAPGPEGVVVTKTYTIDAKGLGDSPYAKQSLWEFYTYVEDDDTADNSAFSGDMRLKATVHRS